MHQFFFEKCLQQRNKVFLAVFCLSVGATLSYANDLITIIGPDGLPMVVPMQKTDSQNKVERKSKESVGEKKSWFKLFSNNGANPPQESSKAVDLKKENIKSDPSTSSRVNSNKIEQKKVVPSTGAKLVTPQAKENAVVKIDERQQAHNVAKEDMLQVSAVVQTIEDSQSIQPQSTPTAVEPPLANDLIPQEPYQVIDGEKYYDAEYLESKEFNIEGHKRFYQIPTPPMSVGMQGMSGGTTNWDMVEREKGVDMSIIRGEAQKQEEAVIALGANYHIIPKEELAEALPIQCVDDKAIRKSKTFGKNDSVSFFPRAPFNDEFDFELLDFDKPVKNLKITSYASNNNSPSYYWPIAIFLDENGCIIEGASAFHTSSHPATMLQSASIDGVIHVPNNSHYLLMSALEYGADVPQLKLSNEGQIKLTMLR